MHLGRTDPGEYRTLLQCGGFDNSTDTTSSIVNIEVIQTPRKQTSAF